MVNELQFINQPFINLLTVLKLKKLKIRVLQWGPIASRTKIMTYVIHIRMLTFVKYIPLYFN
jgi:hypothetical protein